MPLRDDVLVGEGTKIWHPETSNLYGCRIGKNCIIASHVEIGWCTIGDNCKVQAFTYIPPGVTIGKDVFIGPRVTFLNDKYPPSDGKHWGEIHVGDHASIGGCAVILPGVHIGSGAMIGAGAVVTRDVAPSSVVVGNPARRVSSWWRETR